VASLSARCNRAGELPSCRARGVVAGPLSLEDPARNDARSAVWGQEANRLGGANRAVNCCRSGLPAEALDPAPATARSASRLEMRGASRGAGRVELKTLHNSPHFEDPGSASLKLARSLELHLSYDRFFQMPRWPYAPAGAASESPQHPEAG
jgi:hypothetical protein